MDATNAYPDERSFLRRLGEVAERITTQALGAALLGFVAAAGVALATWSVADPSYSHASDREPTNLLGFPGAVVSDFLMQMIGLAAPILLFPLFVWSYGLMRDRPVTLVGTRALSAVCGTFLAAAAMAAVPPSPGWPLPTGLGGYVGDAELFLAGYFLSPVLGPFGEIATGLVAALGAVLLVGHACDLPVTGLFRRRPPVRHDGGRRQVEPAFHGRGRDDEEWDEDDAEEPQGRFMPLGAITHWWLSLRAALRRRSQRTERRPSLSRVLRSIDEAETPSHAGRVEPQMGRTSGRRAATAEPGAEDEEDWQDEPQVERDVERPSRVQTSKARLKQGRRATAGAQHSLLPSPGYEMPPLQLLAQPKVTRNRPGGDSQSLEQNARMLETVLDDFGVKGEIIQVRPGPVVTLYELEPAPGTKSSRVIGLADDIARSMSAISARVAVVPGRNAIGIELPNSTREMVYLRELLASEAFESSKAKLPLCLGKTIGGEPVIADLARMPHLLIAGTTGSGKSVAVNTMILSLLYRLPPEACKLIMIDPKMLELSIYDGIPHLLSPVVTDPRKAVVALKWTVREMEDRYRKMSKLGVRNIDGYNARVAEAAKKGETIVRTVQTGFDRETGEPVYEEEEMPLEAMPYLVVIVDEMADLMMVAGKDIEGAVQRLAQMARAAGIHIITATQRPSVDVITGTIKANFPTRISFQVTSKIDSRTILGEQGAEQLLGQGDMLYMMGGGRIQRVHGPFVSDEEVEDIVAHLKEQGTPEYLEAITDEEGGGDDGSTVFDMTGMGQSGEADDLFQKAVQVVVRDGKASTSYVQRRLQIGYNRAATLIERMEDEGIISRPNSKGQREVLTGAEQDE
ncbi:DNA translocase FtsK [Lutibaculum baratangense]|uniref:DNA translocase FtsK n=1 Tax=Lutibaculum baratangense AMV1 TaxID=631454 RepID=V4RL33_9HYPH|nr:DNA translocase FtsK [Lutibaculum baratangense]ESR23920.1 Cell division protein FtsK [Lutibaculum baratangense AMV1]